MHKSTLLIFILFISCGIDRTISPLDAEQNTLLTQFQNLGDPHKLSIAGPEEPGERLILCLSFTDRETGRPMPGQEVLFYHTSTTGQYQPANPGDESTARLNGRAITNKDGKMYVETILPGDYGSSSDNRHIHTTVFGARPEAYDIHFKQYTGFMGRNFIDGSDQHFLADLKTHNGSLIAFLSIETKN